MGTGGTAAVSCPDWCSPPGASQGGLAGWGWLGRQSPALRAVSSPLPPHVATPAVKPDVLQQRRAPRAHTWGSRPCRHTAPSLPCQLKPGWASQMEGPLQSAGPSGQASLGASWRPATAGTGGGPGWLATGDKRAASALTLWEEGLALGEGFVELGTKLTSIHTIIRSFLHSFGHTGEVGAAATAWLG